jgi:hypothetical protein
MYESVKCSGEEMKEIKEEVKWGNENNKNLDRDERVICGERTRRFAWQVDILERMCLQYSGVESRSDERQEDGAEWEPALCRAGSSEKNRVNFGNFPWELCNPLRWFVVLASAAHSSAALESNCSPWAAGRGTTLRYVVSVLISFVTGEPAVLSSLLYGTVHDPAGNYH